MIRVRRAWLTRLIVALGLSLVAAACGKTDANSGSFPRVISLGGRDIYPELRASALAVGPDRFVLSLKDRSQAPVMDALVHLRFYDLNGPKPAFRFESKTRVIPVQLSFVDEDAGNKTTVTGNDAVYAADVNFDRAGNWGVWIDATRNGKKLTPLPFTFTVLDRSPEPETGDLAPPSRQKVLVNVSNIDEIDSSYPPRTAMHDITVADALKTGKPIVLAFATPAFCESRTCAPIMDTVMDTLYANYGDRAIFVHIEPYDLRELRDTGRRDPVPAMREWRLESEPWIFVIDRGGKIAAKYEGIASADEVAAVLASVLAGGPAPSPAGR